MKQNAGYKFSKVKTNDMKAKEFDIKKRDPNWRAMQDIRRSGAGGQHKDKKKAEKQGEVKHKAKQFAEGVSEGSYTTEKQIMTRIRQIMHDRKLSGTESNAGELLRLKQQLKDLRSQQNMAESLDQPYRIKWGLLPFGNLNAIATLEDGTDLYIRFGKISDQLYSRDQWEIEFYRSDRQDITGEGDAQKIFATVLKAIHEFVRKKEPDSIEFSTNKEADLRSSRTRLYDRLVDRYARDLGYTLQKQEDSSYTTYRLNRKQGVVEGGLREFAPHSGDGSGARWYNDDELADLLGDEWLQDMDVSGNLGHIELAKATTGSTDPAVAWLVDLAQSWLDSQGYHVRVLSARDNEDEGNLDWLIDGVFYRDLDRAKLQQAAQDEHDYYANLYAGLLGQLQDTTWHERAKAWSNIRRALNGGRISLDGVKKKIQDMELEIKKKKGVQEGLINESAIFLNPNAVIVGQEHGRPLDLSPETLKRVKAIAAKHGAWYEGDGGDRAYTQGQIDRYQGSWDDEVAKTASPDDPKWLYVLFANVDENRRIQRVGADSKDTIFNRLLATASDNSFQGMGFTAQALKKFLAMASEGEYDFVRMSQQPATQENLAQFFKAGEALMWPANWEQYPNRAGKIAKAATVGARDQYLANRKSGVYVVGSGHLKAVQQLTGKQGVQEGTGLMPSRAYRILENELDQYQAILKKSREITKSIKYSRVHSEIITEIKMLAEQNKISPEMFDDAISEIFDAASRLESAVYGLEEPIEDRIRNIKNRISELEDEEYYKESNEQQSSCPECGGPLVSESSLSEKQDACYHKVKSRYKVWPSAYASGALVQCRKKGAKNWGNKSK